MADMPEINNLGTTEALVKYVQERSDDIEKAVLFPPGMTLAQNGVRVMGPFDQFALVFHLTNGRSQAIFGGDVEAVLNDGILYRMRIRIELPQQGK
jgi:hypothetical protein